MSIAANLMTITENIPKVYEAGQIAQYNTLWDAKQSYGNRKDWRYAFLSAEGCWTDDTLRPRYDIDCEQGESMFYGLRQVTKLKKGFYGEEDLQINTSKLVIASWMFFDMRNLLELPPLDFSRVTYSQGAFYHCSSLRKLHLTISEYTVFNDATFYGCSSLDDLKITGTIGSDINIADCVSMSGYTVYSQVIQNLKDYSGTNTSHTLVLGDTLRERVTDYYYDAILEAVRKGWTVA